MIDVLSTAVKRIGVTPPSALAERGKLFKALEQVFEVRFEGREAASDLELDARICFLSAEEAALYLNKARLPSFIAVADGERRPAGERSIRLADSPVLDASLRTRALQEDAGERLGKIPLEGTTILAEGEGQPVWGRWRSDALSIDLAATVPSEISADHPLRDSLRPGHFLGLLPLVHFLRERTADHGWVPPQSRAAFVMDDPNLHWPSYGHLDYRELAAHAVKHGYHVAMATVPLDSRHLSRSAARIFRQHPEHLSLLMHGNDHMKRELERDRGEVSTVALLAQAWRRASTLERRSGVRVSRVMTPPHGACSEQTLKAMLRLGYEGLSADRPYPWATDEDGSPFVSPSSEWLHAGWQPADVVAGGFPVFVRHPLAFSRDDLVFRAFLRQPIILTGHHDDAAAGLDVFSEVAHDVNRICAPIWCNLADLARANYMTLHEGPRLHVKMFTRRARVQLASQIREIVVHRPPALESPCEERVAVASDPSRTADFPRESHADALPVRDGEGELDLILRPRESIDPRVVPPPRRRVAPVVRRLATETRDRTQPVRDGMRRVLSR